MPALDVRPGRFHAVSQSQCEDLDGDPANRLLKRVFGRDKRRIRRRSWAPRSARDIPWIDDDRAVKSQASRPTFASTDPPSRPSRAWRGSAASGPVGWSKTCPEPANRRPGRHWPTFWVGRPQPPVSQPAVRLRASPLCHPVNRRFVGAVLSGRSVSDGRSHARKRPRQLARSSRDHVPAA